MSFADAFERARDVPGWLTEPQALVLYAAAAAVPAGGRVVEIGSHLGRSTIILASAGSDVVAIDPFPARWRYGRPDTEQAMRANLAHAQVAERVDLRVASSREVRESWEEPVHLVYVDGKHDYWTVRDDLRWADHLVPGAPLLVHDAFSSLGVTTALLRELLAPGSRLRYLGRTGSLACLVPGRPRPVDRWRVLRELPWFARNLCVKVALRLHLRTAARTLGHTGAEDPY
jgi:predicted O-methyltransferase YrrM